MPVSEYARELNLSVAILTDLVYQKWDRYSFRFGSDGFLYDFVKRTQNPNYIR